MSERSRCESLQSSVAHGRFDVDSGESVEPPEKGVREPSQQTCAVALSDDLTPGSAHPSNRLVAQLNKSWRVVDDPLQWILQRRKGNRRSKSSGWQHRSFCRTREMLLRCIRECCCSPDRGQLRCIQEYRDVDEAALQQIRALPEWHTDWHRSTPKGSHGSSLNDDGPALASGADEVPQ